MIYADSHCHPSFKPFSKKLDGKSDKAPNGPASMWYYDAPQCFLDSIVERGLGIPKWRQSDLSSGTYGDVGLIYTALYPLEQGFQTLTQNRIIEPLKKSAVRFITQLSKPYINRVNAVGYDYFKMLQDEYDYLVSQNGIAVNVSGTANKKRQLAIAQNGTDVENWAREHRITYPAGQAPVRKNIAIVTIEGANALLNSVPKWGQPIDVSAALTNVAKVKAWAHPPFIITFAHHFWNGLCGHAPSLPDILLKFLSQSPGLNTRFTNEGLAVLKALLNNANGERRILIDCKHMSPASRTEYYNYLTQNNLDDVPVLFTHCAVQGMPSNPGGDFMKDEININDEEIRIVGRTGGLIGLQLDERRLTSLNIPTVRNDDGASRSLSSRELWKNVAHVARVLDAAGLPAWDVTCIGSDYDGMIDPIPGFWSHEQFRDLHAHLLVHAQGFMSNHGTNLTQPFNRLDASEIVRKVMGENAYNFAVKHYR